MAQNDVSDDWEGFKLFTPADLESLRERRKRLEDHKCTEKYSGAKHSILKGDELFICTNTFCFFNSNVVIVGLTLIAIMIVGLTLL